MPSSLSSTQWIFAGDGIISIDQLVEKEQRIKMYGDKLPKNYILWGKW